MFLSIGVTENFLNIPTTFTPGVLEIKLEGTSSLEHASNTPSEWRYVNFTSLTTYRMLIALIPTALSHKSTGRLRL